MNYFYNKRVLVTGGAGFIGSHLATTLVKLGAHVTILDNLSTGSLVNIAGIQSAVIFKEGDCTNLATALEVCQHQEIVFHLAAATSVQESTQNPYKNFVHNVNGTAAILEATWRSKNQSNMPCVIFSSSAAVYGARDDACKETDSCNPLSPYGYSKYIGELLCSQYAMLGLPTVSLRYFNVVGERQSPKTVSAQFQDAIKHNRPLIIKGDGQQTRDFVPVDRVVVANLAAAYYASSTNYRSDISQGTTTLYNCFNVASGKSISLLDLAHTLSCNNPNFTAGIVHEPSVPLDINHSVGDCSKLNHLLYTTPPFEPVHHHTAAQAEVACRYK